MAGIAALKSECVSNQIFLSGRSKKSKQHELLKHSYVCKRHSNANLLIFKNYSNTVFTIQGIEIEARGLFHNSYS